MPDFFYAYYMLIMKRVLLVILLALSASIYAGAHDIIVKCNGEEIKALVVEVNPTSVKFKRMDNPNGPVYVCDLKDIQSIKYENGMVETYNEPAPEQPRYYAERYDVRYRDIKGWYNPRNYVSSSDEPYSPFLAGISSWIIPGLGQCIDGEWGRGIGIIAANIGFATLEATGLSLAFFYSQPVKIYDTDYGRSYPYSIRSYNDELALLCIGCTLLTAAVHTGMNIWNIFDAVNIAKVKNMYYMDASQNTAAFDLHLEPQLTMTPSNGYGLQPTAGFKLSVSF